MPEFLQSISSELIAGFLGITGVLLGSRISSTSTYKIEQMKILSTIYAEIFSLYITCAASGSPNDCKDFFLAIEKARLLCSKESDTIMIKILEEFMAAKPNISKCSDLMEELHESARKEIKKI